MSEVQQHRISNCKQLWDHVPNAAIHSLYMHIPFCIHKCHYCDFYSITHADDKQDAFTDALIQQMRLAYTHFTSPLRTIFVGGGTPTLLRLDCWKRILSEMYHLIDMNEIEEWTLEANPETVTPELLRELHRHGVNRISIGCQSFNMQHLQTLERHHHPENVVKAVEMARQVGIQNVSLDLIFAIPGQTLSDWQDDLRRAIELKPDHLSCYNLTYEEGTKMTKRLALKQFSPCDEELEVKLYYQTIETLAAHGYEQYEISNYAQPGKQCQHNLAYWHNHNWLALGPSASGHIDGWRWKTAPKLAEYLDSAPDCSIMDVEKLSPEDSAAEQFMLRIRLNEGIPRKWIEKHFDEARREQIEKAIARDQLKWEDHNLKLTREGMLLTNEIAMAVL